MMKKIFIASGIVLVLIILIAVGAAFLVSDKADDLKEKWDKNEGRVGEQIVLREDTLYLMNYNKLSNEFILEDGRRASPEMVNVLLLRD